MYIIYHIQQLRQYYGLALPYQQEYSQAAVKNLL